MKKRTKTRTMAQAFNEWMHRYINDPEGFEREFESVLNFCEDKRTSREPSYGQQCEAYLKKLMSEPARRGLHLKKLIEKPARKAVRARRRRR